jgi:hypothetical protein
MINSQNSEDSLMSDLFSQDGNDVLEKEDLSAQSVDQGVNNLNDEISKFKV